LTGRRTSSSNDTQCDSLASRHGARGSPAMCSAS
jgi:hypothetical protein